MIANGVYPKLLDHILNGERYMPLIESPEVAEHRTAWRELFKELIACPPMDAAIAKRFHTRWHESHHFMRRLIENDELLLDVAWVWLPPYAGPPLSLFRGENIDRREAGRIGSAWTDQEQTAKTFARGLNAVGRGGVVLRTTAPAEAIIAGPSDHSANWLREREFSLDPRKLGSMDVISVHPASG